MDAKTKEALLELVNHVMQSERQHWQDCEQPEKHAYSYAVTVSHWLNKSDAMAKVRRTEEER